MKLRLLAAAALLAMLSSACQMEIGIGAKLNADGSGLFSMAVALDKEFIDGLAEANRESGADPGRSGIQGFEDFFASLKSQGWDVKRSQTQAGDVAFSGRCAFPDVAGFDRCVNQVGSAEGGEAGFRFGDAGLAFDFGADRGFMRTKTFFAGSVNLVGPTDDRGRELVKSIQALADQFFNFEIRAELPGSLRITRGGGSVRDGIAVWKPRVGEKLEFRAESDALNPLALAVLAIPLLGLLGGGAWLLLRRKPSLDAGGFSHGPPEEPAREGGEGTPREHETEVSP